MSTLYIGIDPGASGAIAFMGDSGEVWTVTHSETPHDQSEALRDALKGFKEVFCIIERVWAMPGQGVTSMFNFGKSFGISLGLLTAHQIPYEMVTPQKWQAAFNLPTKKVAGSTTNKKNVHKERAQELFPSLTITHKIADALLIAKYAKEYRII
jgi:crossover junction endodeoxyribonuclease RuvC